MKADLSELLKGGSLKSEIYRTISGSKFGSIGHLLKNSVKKGVKYVQFASQGTQPTSDIIKPTMKSNRSMKKLNSSANDSSLSNKKISKQASRQKLGHAQRSQRRLKAVSGSQRPQKNRNYMLVNSQKSSKQKGMGKKGVPEATFPSSNKNQKKASDVKQKSGLSKSKSKLSCKMNLSSIIQQSSSEQQLITPQHKKNGLLTHEGIQGQQQKTTKKYKNEPISEQIRKKIAKSFISPQKFIKLIKTDSLTISYRVLKRKLIEIEIFVLKNISHLSVTLQKGNLQCQSIQETYSNLAPQTLLALFSSVRDINILDPYAYPELHIEVNSADKQQNINRYLTLPYTFLNFSDEKEPLHKRSRIRTKLCLQGLPINPKKMKLLSSVFKTWQKRQFKGESQFETHFNIGDHDFRLRLIQEKQTFALQLQGRGEQKLTKVIDFFSKLIC